MTYPDKPLTTETSRIIRITKIGLWLNVILFGIKLGTGLFVGSAALVADAVHSISDFFTDIVVILGVQLSSRPADPDHEYGHGKYETIATLVVGTVLVGAGFFLAVDAATNISRGETISPGYPVLIVALLSIASKEWMFQITMREGKRFGSPALHVNAWHHRSDALSSIAVLFGAVIGLAGWGHGDHLAAVVVGLMIVFVGAKAIWKCFRELSESSVSEQERMNIIEAIQGVSGVRGWHRLRTRLVGREIFMDVHVVVDAHLTVDEGHAVCTAVEEAISHSIKRQVNIVVHCEPTKNLRNL